MQVTTMAVTKHEEPMLRIDESRKYAINAGRCEKCGNYKTWEFRVANQKSGKMMPGHVTRDGFKINDGDCPYYAMMAARRAADPPPPAIEQAATAPVPAVTQAPPVQGIGVQAGPGSSVIVAIGGIQAVLGKDEAIKACAAILAVLSGSGA